jgi:DNA-binding transcriptional ArsR family regulator
MNLAMGVTQYHLYSLEKERKILSRRRGLYKRFYSSLTFGENQEAILDVLSQETERDLLLFIIENPGTNQRKISEYAQISASSVNWHMKRMADSGLIKLKREGQFVRYEIAGEKEQILRLVRGYHPNLWEKWADRLTIALNEISPEINTFDLEDSQETKEIKTSDKGKNGPEKQDGI